MTSTPETGSIGEILNKIHWSIDMAQMPRDKYWVVEHANYAARYQELDETLTRDEIRELAHLCDIKDKKQYALRKMCLKELARQAVRLLTGAER